MNRYKEHWIRVITTSGMFSNESGVSLELANGEGVSFFVDNSLLKRDQSGNSLLKVTLIKDIPEEKKQVVLLPAEPCGAFSSRWAEVAIA